LLLGLVDGQGMAEVSYRLSVDRDVLPGES